MVLDKSKLFHDPVMVEEVFGYLQLQPGDVYADGTLGLAGHAIEASKRVGSTGKVLGFDWDTSMLELANERLADGAESPYQTFHSDYRGMPEILAAEQVAPNGILIDNGLSSVHLEDPSRGITFREEGPLDMRLDRSRGETASAMLNRMSPVEIERVLWEFGDERWAKAIAKSIVERRRSAPLRTTTDLVDAVLAAIPPKARDKRIHPATRSFQAVRIAVNREIEGLQEAIEEIARSLAPGGRLVVLSYHSGEDRATKRAMQSLSGEGFEELTDKPVGPTANEIAKNSRSRSAKLRAIRKI